MDFALTTSGAARVAGTNETRVRLAADREQIPFKLDSNGRRLFSADAAEQLRQQIERRAGRELDRA
jgi:hypothetical protein